MFELFFQGFYFVLEVIYHFFLKVFYVYTRFVVNFEVVCILILKIFIILISTPMGIPDGNIYPATFASCMCNLFDWVVMLSGRVSFIPRLNVYRLPS